MIKDESMPYPTHWTQVFVSWERMLEQHGPDCRQILNWIENEYSGVARYQLRGPNWEPTSGFLFYFEDARDAEVFILKWL
jgi:hypothetical protein